MADLNRWTIEITVAIAKPCERIKLNGFIHHLRNVGLHSPAFNMCPVTFHQLLELESVAWVGKISVFHFPPLIG